MKKLLISMGMLCTIVNINAQKDDLYSFQKQNPEIEFISQENFNYLSEDEKEIIKGKFIVFNNKIEESDLTTYASNKPSQKSLQSTPELDTEMSDDEKNIVKVWLGNHSNVKIVKQSEYQALSAEDQIVYHNNHCLILISEVLTLTDIELYPY